MGGGARWFVELDDRAQLAQALAWARGRGVPVFVLGGGSNLLVADDGFEGLVVRPRLRGISERREGDHVRVTASAGEAWDDLVRYAVERGYGGIECMSGVAGSVGAAPIQNIGAYGQEVADSLVSVEVMSRESGEVSSLSAEACRFGYRDSVFKRALRDVYIVLSIDLALRSGAAPTIRYPELARALEGRAATLAEARQTVLALRRAKSMLVDPADENGRSAGSFFVNPVVSVDDLAAIERSAAACLAPGESMPRYAAGPGMVKLSAAWLIERAGFAKGTREGAVGLSTKHCLAVVAHEGASAAEIIRFARRISSTVRGRFGVLLEPEPVRLGFDDPP